MVFSTFSFKRGIVMPRQRHRASMIDVHTMRINIAGTRISCLANRAHRLHLDSARPLRRLCRLSSVCRLSGAYLVTDLG